MKKIKSNKRFRTYAGILFYLTLLLIVLGIWVDGYHLKFIATAIFTGILTIFFVEASETSEK